MSITLKNKKRILTFVLTVLLTGNVINFLNTYSIDKNIAVKKTTYATNDFGADAANIAFAAEQVPASKDIVIAERVEDLRYDKEQIRKIEAFLSSRGAPLASEADTFVKMADKYGLPYNLMPAISIIESSGGKYNYRPYNYAGMGGQGNAMVFSNYDEAIEKHAQILKKGYFDKGATTPEQIEKYYCYQCPTWGEKVQSMMNQIDAM